MKQLSLRNSCKLLLPLVLLAAACNDTPTKPTPPPAPAEVATVPTTISYDIINEYPHDPQAYTEGLEYKDGFLYESTGQYGSSDIRKADLKTGKVLLITPMDKKYFGEGMTILNGKIYQITYREGKGFVYDLATLKQERTFTYNASEGWGMTNNGTHLVFDDGTNVLHFVEPATFKEVKRLEVRDEHGPVEEINEAELINGYIYVNQWRTDLILKIDTTTGRVVGRADLSSLRQRAGIPAPSENGAEVLNGIAYDAATNRIFITGKRWPKLFEIKLDN